MNHNAVESTKNICCAKDEGTVEQPDGSRNFARGARTLMIRQGQVDLKLDSKAVLKAIKANPVSSTWRVSDKPGIL